MTVESIRIVRPTVPLDWTGERYTTGANEQVEIEHYHRYLIARELGSGRDILDAACGEGYGSALMAQTARSVVGIDISAQAIDFANAVYARENLAYTRGDIETLHLGEARFDAIVSFETIEHIAAQDHFLATCQRLLRPEGYLLISSPDLDYYNSADDTENPYHVKELTERDFIQLVQKHFRYVARYRQVPMVGSIISGEDAPAGTVFERVAPAEIEAAPEPQRAPYAVILASNHAPMTVPSSAYIHRRTVEEGAPGQITAREWKYTTAVEKMRGEIYTAAERAALLLTDGTPATDATRQTLYDHIRQIMTVVSNLSSD